MTWQDRNPLANPLNSRQKPSGIHVPCNPSDLTVPDTSLSYDQILKMQQARRSLTVPNQDIPPGDQLRGNGFLGMSDRLFRLADGTVVDFKTRKVIYSPNKEGGEYWGDPCRTISFGNVGSWNEDETKLEDLISRIDQYYGRAQSSNAQFDALNAQLDPESVQYWLRAEEEAEKMKDAMTQQQKQMIADFEKHFPKSRLIEEAKRVAQGSML